MTFERKLPTIVFSACILPLTPGDRVRISDGWFKGLVGVVSRAGMSRQGLGYLVNVRLRPDELSAKMHRSLPFAWILDQEGLVEMTFSGRYVELAP